MVVFRVADTGIGIAAENQSIVFEEFGQVAHQLQRRARGTGLGLPLSRRLAELLGGTLTLQSESGAGSVFTVTLPANYVAARPAAAAGLVDGRRRSTAGAHARRRAGRGAGLRADVEGLTLPAATGTIRCAKPTLPSTAWRPPPSSSTSCSADEAWDFLIRLKRDHRTRHVPVVVASVIDAREKALALGADAFLVKPIQRATLIETLTGLHARMHPPIRVLVVDDEESARYLVRRCLPAPGFEVIEVADANDAVRRASTDAPDVILLDLVMPAMSGHELLGGAAAASAHHSHPGRDRDRGDPDRGGPAGARGKAPLPSC